MNTIVSIWCENNIMSLDIIYFSKFTVFLELSSWKTVHFSEQTMSVDKYLSIFPCQMEATVYSWYN